MALNRRRRMTTYNAPKVEVVKIDPPQMPFVPPMHEDHMHEIPPNKTPPASSGNLLANPLGSIKNFLSGFLKNFNFDGEDILLVGLILLFMNNDDEDYAMMVPALIYILLG